MHPPFSLIWFFITAGISIGLFNFVYFLELLTLFGHQTAMPRQAVLISLATSLVLIALGAIGASFHLGHKLRAWKAIKRFHTSWLSREAVFSGAYGFTLFLYALSYYSNQNLALQHFLGILTLILGWLSSFSTAMIYASNKFVPEWNTSLTVLYYLNMYLMLGASSATILTALFAPQLSGEFFFLTALFLVLGFFFRLFFNIRQAFISHPTLNEALNLAHNRPMRVIDTGSTTNNYCTTEFYYKKGKELLSSIVPLSYILTFLIPTFLTLYALITTRHELIFIAPAFAFITLGSFLERWCFFVEGNHVQNLYYGIYPSQGYSLRKGYTEHKKTIIRY
ncbi:MAG: sulfur reductase subunit SreC [Aquificaceae bacterium]|nr:sulfur reductase subunit SreC [Aquificaceae bacterium]MDW8237746.1 sulfur reductase subunit SreC [Aquificaceae bacterium]